MQWKYLFAEKFRLRRNWLKGYCNVRTFEGHTQGIKEGWIHVIVLYWLDVSHKY